MKVATTHRRFMEWTEAGLWRRLHQAVLDELGSRGMIDWSRAMLDGASLRAKRGTGNRPEPGRSRQARFQDPRLSDRSGTPLAVGISAANTHDNAALKPLVLAIPAIRSRRGPRRFRPTKLHADKTYDVAELRDWLRNRGIVPRLARKGIESSTKLGRHRWVIERTIAWLSGYRRLTIRYERYGTLFRGFLTLAAALTATRNSPSETSSNTATTGCNLMGSASGS
ncbi:IS5 family transposase [Saccharopolyspora sp. K220]|uniref:IS5 family transposase n=1 Tax=Saccharopolyspora soli TaxID=2926618 RepID=UPI001F577200|nr:IS5 family transposase [Saccharopolyspora soli]